MKALIIILVILFLLAGAAFFAGWIQMLLPAETYGVIFTKTGGLDKKVVYPGEFSWRWERLIPTNLTLYKYKLTAYKLESTLKGTLPSAETYSSVLQEKPDFSYEIKLTAALRIRPEKLVDLTAEEKITPDNLEDFLKSRADTLAQKFSKTILKSPEVPAETITTSALTQKFKQSIPNFFPELEITDLAVLNVKLPDMELYSRARESYFNIMAVREASQVEIAAQVIAEQEEHYLNQQRERENLELLRQYGELLSKHPILIKFLYLKYLEDGDELQIPEFNIPESILEDSKQN
ncbi:MAG: hypothetical protein GH155_00435 [Spirochaeta sp.]|nr:hypothetical protein [Spirochaeta sp.]